MWGPLPLPDVGETSLMRETWEVSGGPGTETRPSLSGSFPDVCPSHTEGYFRRGSFMPEDDPWVPFPLTHPGDTL